MADRQTDSRTLQSHNWTNDDDRGNACIACYAEMLLKTQLKTQKITQTIWTNVPDSLQNSLMSNSVLFRSNRLFLYNSTVYLSVLTDFIVISLYVISYLTPSCLPRICLHFIEVLRWMHKYKKTYR